MFFPRRVSFLVFSEVAPAAELTARLGPPDESGDGSWEITEAGDDSAPVEALVTSVLDRMRPHRATLELLDCTTILRIVAYYAESDRVGQGLGLSTEDLKFLAAVGAVVDADQYVSSGSASADALPSAAGPPDRWSVTLHDGSHLTVAAHSYGRDGEELVFDLLVRPEPGARPELFTVLRLPARLVEQVLGGGEPAPGRDPGPA